MEILGSESNYCKVAGDWLRVLRGRRSQVAFSRRLGYRSNVAYRWETGRSFPSASRMLSAIDRLGGDVAQCLERFYRYRPAWLDTLDPTTVQGVGQLLDDLRGKTSVAELARCTGHNRFALARWLRGQADPSLPELLMLIAATSERLLDFVASFTDPVQLPSVREQWLQLLAAREAAYELPWSFAVLRALELVDYQALPQHVPGWIASRLAIEREQELESLVVLERTRQIQWTGTHFRSASLTAVDTRAEAERALQLRVDWGQEALTRLQRGATGMASYNLSCVSRIDRDRIEQLQRAHYRQVSSIIARSFPAQCVLLQTSQFIELTVAAEQPIPCRPNSNID